MKVGSNVGAPDGVQQVEQRDDGDNSVQDDPFLLTREAFYQGLDEFGSHLKLDDAAIKQLWEAVSDGKLMITQDDFSLADFNNMQIEFNGNNERMMQGFAHFIETHYNES